MPLNPDSDAGKACADALTAWLADVEVAVAQRKPIKAKRTRRHDEAA